jgi:hypothetical protein
MHLIRSHGSRSHRLPFAYAALAVPCLSTSMVARNDAVVTPKAPACYDAPLKTTVLEPETLHQRAIEPFASIAGYYDSFSNTRRDAVGAPASRRTIIAHEP